MKRHYEIMRIMRTKILNMRELLEGAQSIIYIREAIGYRVQDLIRVLVLSSTVPAMLTWFVDNFTQQRLDPEKQIQSFAFGIVGYLSFCGTVLPSNVPHSSSITTIERLYGLWTTFAVLVLKSYHTTRITRTKMFNLEMF